MAIMGGLRQFCAIIKWFRRGRARSYRCWASPQGPQKLTSAVNSGKLAPRVHPDKSRAPRAEDAIQAAGDRCRSAAGPGRRVRLCTCNGNEGTNQGDVCATCEARARVVDRPGSGETVVVVQVLTSGLTMCKLMVDSTLRRTESPAVPAPHPHRKLSNHISIILGSLASCPWLPCTGPSSLQLRSGRRPPAASGGTSGRRRRLTASANGNARTDAPSQVRRPYTA